MNTIIHYLIIYKIKTGERRNDIDRFKSRNEERRWKRYYC